MMIDLKSVPDKPGCYLFKDRKGIIIYVGKAKILKYRVRSYFSGKHDEKTELLIRNISSMDYIVTKTEVEALLLENNLIKKHKPRYNIDLRDSKRYAYILLTKEDFPRLMVARDKLKKGKYFGPFTSAEKRSKVIKLLRMVFKLRTCNKMPKRACLRYHIKLCSAPCINNITKTEYADKIKAIGGFLKGDVKKVVKTLDFKMTKFSSKEMFEEAMEMRDSINALKTLDERQRAELDKTYDQDAINYLVSKGTIFLVVFNVHKGVLINKTEFEFDYKEGFMEEFLLRYYDEADVPREIIIPTEVDESLAQYLSLKRREQTSRRVSTKVVVPKKGDKKELLDIAMINLENSFRKDELSIKDLQTKLRMQSLPEVIECFDISNIQGSFAVGSMVQFRGGKPDKRNYRRFRIKTVEGIDDFAMMREVVRRRYSRLRKENAEMPDLIVLDGGKGQLSSAIEILKEQGLKIPTISLAKKLEEVFVPGRRYPLVLPTDSYALKLLQRVRDEAHRFAITYHRLLRSKSIKH